MAKPTLGQLVEFDPVNGSVSAYIEQVELFFEANEIRDAKKVPVFLSAIGGKTYTLLRNLLAPSLPKENLFGILVQALKDHFESRPLVITERFQFHRRDLFSGRVHGRLRGRAEEASYTLRVWRSSPRGAQVSLCMRTKERSVPEEAAYRSKPHIQESCRDHSKPGDSYRKRTQIASPC